MKSDLEASAQSPKVLAPKILAPLEVLLIFALFFAIAGSAAPDVNEAHYLAKARQSNMDVPYDPEAYVRTRILALTEYVYRLQAK